MDAAPYVEALARRYMRAMARYWCGGVTGRSKLDPVYMQITEGRDVRAGWTHYSSCGDLSQALCQHMGAEGVWINRASYRGWTPGKNLIDFYDAHGPAESTPVGYLPEPGDIGFIWLTGNDAHTFVFGDVLEGGHIETFNYGAGGMSASGLGAHQAASTLKLDGAAVYIGTRILHKVLTVPKLLSMIDTAKLPPMSGELVAEIEGRISE